MRLEYRIVDVFTDRPFTGNPLAVVLDADGLEPKLMAAIAREFNLSETAFVLRPADSADYRVRIFTPGGELPFAGHPSVGTAATLARLGRLKPGELIQECGAGLVPVLAETDRATLSGAEASVGSELDPGPLLAAAGLAPSDLAPYPARTASAGLDHVFLPVIEDAVARAELDLGAARANGVEKLYLFSWDSEPRRVHARFFGPGVGVLEDPATGSAGLALGVWLHAAGLVADDTETAYTIHQGVEMGRPSVLDCTVSVSGGVVTRTAVSGGVAPVAEGHLEVPATAP